MPDVSFDSRLVDLTFVMFVSREIVTNGEPHNIKSEAPRHSFLRANVKHHRAAASDVRLRMRPAHCSSACIRYADGTSETFFDETTTARGPQ